MELSIWLLAIISVASCVGWFVYMIVAEKKLNELNEENIDLRVEKSLIECMYQSLLNEKSTKKKVTKSRGKK